MKKLLIFLFSILISFNSYGDLFDKTVCVETDSQLRDGIIYLPNKTKPFTGKNLCKYESGQFKSEGKVKDGKKDSKWVFRKKNGQLHEERKYNAHELQEGSIPPDPWCENWKEILQAKGKGEEPPASINS